MALKLSAAPNTIARPDDRGRVTLGNAVTSGVSRYDVFLDEETGDILLRPYKEIPAREAWLYENPKAHKLVIKGLSEAKEGKVRTINLNESRWADDIEDPE